VNDHGPIDIIETLPVIVWTARPDGVVDYISSDLQDITGPNDVPPEEWLEHVHPDDHDTTLQLWAESLETGSLYEAQFRIGSREDGEYRWHLVRARPNHDARGRITKWFGVALDIEQQLRTETALASVRWQARQILECSGDGIHGVDRDGTVTVSNSRSAQILGYRQEDLIGKPSHATIHYRRADGSPFPEAECPIHKTIADGRTRRVSEDHFITRDGKPVPVAYTVAAITEPEQDEIIGAVVNFRDISAERKHQQLRELESRVLDCISRDQPLAEILDTITTSIESIQPGVRASILLLEDDRLWHASAPSLPDDFTQAVDGIAAAEAAGSCGTAAWRCKTVISRDVATDPLFEGFRELAREHDIAACWSTPVMGGNDEVLATLAVYLRETSEPGQDDLALVERVAQFVALAIERSRQRNALRESEERFRAVATATSDVIWDWDLATDRIWWSDGIEKQFSYRLSELANQKDSWTRMIHPDDRDWVVQSLDRALDSGADQWREEYRMVSADGRELLVTDRGRIIRDPEGRAVRMVGSLNDVTEIRRLEKRLQQAQRLEAVGQLTGGIAHDFNNLLTVILGNAELLRESSEDEESRSLAEMIRNAATQGADLTSRLLSFARKQALEPEPTDVNQLIAGMDQMLRRTIDESIEIETIRAGGLWPAIVDSGQLESALLNLCINARDAMDEGGKLTIETANARLDDEYAAAAVDVSPGQYVQISVSDTGRGMDEQTLARAFEPFFTTKSEGRGNGLGLSMVHGFASQSGGHARIYSEPGQGTTVKLYLPRAADQRAVNPRREVSGSSISTGTETILVVEDNDMVRSHVERLLGGLGYTVLSAADGQQALEILSGDAQVDLLFTDVVMPGGLSGRQLADKAREIDPDLPILYTSGYTENAIVHQGRLDEGVHLLQKPYRREELSTKIRRVLAEADGK